MSSCLTQAVFLGCAFLGAAMLSGLFLAGGLLFAEWCEVFEDSPKSHVAWILSLNSGLFFVACPFASFLTKKLGNRVAYAVGVALAAAGVFGSAFATSIVQLCILYGVCAGPGGGLVYVITVVTVHLRFKRRYQSAVAFTIAGVPCGVMLASLGMPLLIEEYSWRGALFLFSALLLNAFAFAFVMKLPEEKKKTTTPPDSQESLKEESETSVTKTSSSCTWCDDYRSLLHYPHALQLFVIELLGSFAFFIFFGVITKHAEQAGHSSRSAATLVTGGGLGNLCGRLLTCVISLIPCVRSVDLLTVNCLLISIPYFLVPVLTADYLPLLIVSTAHGLFYGGYTSAEAPTMADGCPLSLMGVAVGLFYLSAGIGITSGPPVAGLIFDTYGSFDIAFYISGGICFVCGVWLAVLAIYRRLRRQGDGWNEEEAKV